MVTPVPPDSPIDVGNAKPAAWATALATRLKYLQANLPDATPEARQVQIEQELSRALQELPVEKRGSHLYALAQAFPDWELAAATALAPAAAKRLTPEELIQSFLQLIPQLSAAQREALKKQLAAAGVVQATGTPIEGPALVAVRTKLKLDAEDPINGEQLAALFAAYAEAMLALDQLAWNVWRNAAPKSPIKRDISQGDLRTVTRRALAGDAESATVVAHAQKQLEASRQLIAGLLAGLGPAGKNFARRYQQRYTPDAVREVVRAEGGGKNDVQFWKKHTELAAEITETVIEDDVQAAVVKYAEDLMRGSQRE
jgi:hypothetical protein